MPNNNPQSPPQPSTRTATSSKIAERLEQTAEQTSRLADKLGQTAEDQASAAIQRLQDVGQQARAGLEQQRAEVAKRVRRLSDVLRAGSESLGEDDPVAANVLGFASERVDNIAAYVAELSPGGLAEDVRSLAHRKPGLFFGAAFVLGLGLGRFAKSSGGGEELVASDTSAARRSAFGGPQESSSRPQTTGETAPSAEQPERKEGTKS